MQEAKRFVIAYKDELDNGLSGYTLIITTKPAGEVMGARSSAQILVNEPISPEKESEIRVTMKMLNLKTNKWFTEKDTPHSAKYVKAKLGFSFFGKLFNRNS
ncbi:hypothetical protein [Amphritea sp.]|uniref:hypothetical protein n=1 Tax=Amphritea sp. TaxID=1872502 RepID=UPI0025C05181|nr:hypothetical protein [Amphritea sp.]